MACTQQSASVYLENARCDLVTRLQNLPLIIENLYQCKVFNDHEVDDFKAEKKDFDKARFILDCVHKKGEEASYELLRILDITRKKTLHPDSHMWISCFPFREDDETDYSAGTKPCHSYQQVLKTKAEKILRRQLNQWQKYLKCNPEETFIPLVLHTDKDMCTAKNKIEMKTKKSKKLRHKKLMCYIPVQKQRLSPEDILDSHHRAVLLIGKPGIGKTTVVLKMLSIWSQKDDRTLDYMFYFDDSTLSQVSDPVCLENLLFDIYAKPLEKDRKEVFQDIEENPENVIIVIDGINNLQNNRILEKIMDHDFLPNAKIVLTCRSEEEDDFLFSDWPDCKVYVQGFSEDSIRTYLTQVMGSDSDLLNTVLNNQELFSLCHVPMYAAMVAASVLFQSRAEGSPKDLQTVTEMYVQIFRQDLKKAGKKTSCEVDKYMKDMRDQLCILMKCAFDATMQKTVNIANIDCDETEISQVFLKKITIEETPTSVEKFYAFLHNTVQEFFSALWLVMNEGEIDGFLQLCLTKEKQHMKHVIPFLCGLQSEQNLKLLKGLYSQDQIKRASDELLIKVINTFLDGPIVHEEDFGVDSVFICQCLYEFQSPEACLMFLEKVNYHLDLSEEELDPHQWCAVSYVISQSNEKQVDLSLWNCRISDSGIQMLLNITPNLKNQSSTFCHMWMSVLCCEIPRDYTTLLRSCGREIHIPSAGRKCMFIKAGEIISQSLEKINLYLHCSSLQLSDDFCNMFFKGLTRINSLRFHFAENVQIQMEHRSQILESIQFDLVLKGVNFETQQIGIVSSILGFLHQDPFHLCDFLIKLHLHVKTTEDSNQLEAINSLIPSVWYIDLSERKASLFLEVLKLQKVKKPVLLRGCSDEENEVRSFLQCLPHISQLSFAHSNRGFDVIIKFLLHLLNIAAKCERETGERTLELLTSVCKYEGFPFNVTERSFQRAFFLDLCLQAALHQRDTIQITGGKLVLPLLNNPDYKCNFLLDLYSHVKHYETETGRRVLPALQPLYQSAPAVWYINLSERKASLFLEVLTLHTVKKPVVLRGCSDEESEVRIFLQCLPHISQLSGNQHSVLSLCKVAQTKELKDLLQALDFTLSLRGALLSDSCRAVRRLSKFSKFRLTLNTQVVSLKGARLLLRNMEHLHTLRLNGGLVVKMERALRTLKYPSAVNIGELFLIQKNTHKPEIALCRVLSSLASLLRVWKVQCLNLTEYKIKNKSLIVLLCHESPLKLRLSKETLQDLGVMVYEAQEEELTCCFLQKVSGDLTSCSLNWQMIYYFQEYHSVTVDFRKSNINEQNISELLSVLSRVQFRRLSSVVMLSIIREIYESRSAHCVSSLLSSVENCINLNNRQLDSVSCAALFFILQQCTAVSLNLQWTSIPEGELQNIVPMLNNVTHLSVDRLLLLRLLHCCSVSELQQGAVAVLFSSLQHKLDFSCRSSVDLIADTETNTLFLNFKDCRVISMAIQRVETPTQLILDDCEIEEVGVEELFTILHTVTLSCSKALLLKFLAFVRVGSELECVTRAVSLSKALRDKVDLSHSQLDLQACRSLALFLEHSEGLSELDLSHCHLTDDCLDLLLPHLHKIQDLDLSNNDITDHGAARIYCVVSSNSNVQTVRLFNNRITDRRLFESDQRFQIW